MKILHISAECYPAAKVGGLGDVVGALPKYLNTQGESSGVLIPKYKTKWIEEQSFTPVFQGSTWLHNHHVWFRIEQLESIDLGYPLFVANIPDYFDRPGVYADPSGYSYGDEIRRFLAFQQAALQWVSQSSGKPQLIHCHDHHTGLIPFMMKYCPEYNQVLGNIPTVFTIHNGEYHGTFGWDKMYLLPHFEKEAKGILDWKNAVTPLAAAIKSAWRITTVSPSYLGELMTSSKGLESLLIHEQHKSLGIINGIDSVVWDPKTDPYISDNLKRSIPAFKKKNKETLKSSFPLDMKLPLVTFIGRLAKEKGADLIPDLVHSLMHSDLMVAIAILGTGDPKLHDELAHLNFLYPGRFHARLEYNEGLAHQLYAGSDFLLMPSRVEPCGLNQMYAMAYGTIPIVRSVGGLSDTVIDLGETDGSGRGFSFNDFTVHDAHTAVYRATELYKEKEQLDAVRKKVMDLDFSWEASAKAYIKVYDELLELI
jgi:starch synthase